MSRPIGKVLLLGFALCFWLATQGIAQTATTAPLILEKIEFLPPASVASTFATLLRADQEIKAIDVNLASKGLVAGTGDISYWGVKAAYGTGADQVTVTMVLRSYSPKFTIYTPVPQKTDAYAAAQVTVSGQGRSDTYSFSLLAPKGDFSKSSEWKVVDPATLDVLNLSVSPAFSWWSCVWSYLRNKCAGICAAAAVHCVATSATWPAYLACVAGPCGGCLTKALVCCTCNCRWWCKWACGCCHR